MTTPNYSLLSPNKFKVNINLFPDISFWSQRIILPTITLGQNRMSIPHTVDWFTPGDKLEYDDLIISLIADEDLVAYRKVKDWQEEIISSESPKDRFSDLSIFLLTNNSNKNITFKFKNTYPYLISTLMLDTSQAEDQPMTVDINFKHSHFEILPEL